MAAKKRKRTLPKHYAKIPKGRKRSEYSDEALLQLRRTQQVKRQAVHRAKVRHLSDTRQVSFPMPGVTRQRLAERAAAAGLTRSAFIIRLIDEGVLP
jgi:hypothetical protein